VSGRLGIGVESWKGRFDVFTFPRVHVFMSLGNRSYRVQESECGRNISNVSSLPHSSALTCMCGVTKLRSADIEAGVVLDICFGEVGHIAVEAWGR